MSEGTPISFEFKQNDLGLSISLSVSVSSEALGRALRGDDSQGPALGIGSEELREVRLHLQQEAVHMLGEVGKRLQIRLLQATFELLASES